VKDNVKDKASTEPPPEPRREEVIFDSVIGLPPDQRPAYLNRLSPAIPKPASRTTS